MRFGYTILYVGNVAKAIDFYERAFSVSRRFITEDETYGELATGEVTLSFAMDSFASGFFPGGHRRNDPAEPPAGIEIGFVTDDVSAAWEKALAAGASALSPPETQPWGQTVAYVRDLDGVLIEICTPLSD